MISALEAGGSGDPCFINLHIPTAELFKKLIFFSAPLAKSVFISTYTSM